VLTACNKYLAAQHWCGAGDRQARWMDRRADGPERTHTQSEVPRRRLAFKECGPALRSRPRGGGAPWPSRRRRRRRRRRRAAARRGRRRNRWRGRRRRRPAGPLGSWAGAAGHPAARLRWSVARTCGAAGARAAGPGCGARLPAAALARARLDVQARHACAAARRRSVRRWPGRVGRSAGGRRAAPFRPIMPTVLGSMVGTPEQPAAARTRVSPATPLFHRAYTQRRPAGPRR